MKTQEKLLILLNVILIIMAVSYLETKTNLATSENVPLNVPVDGQVKTLVNDVNGNIYTLETKLVGQKKENGYLVEIYREYEIYKDNNGKIIKSIPTSHFEYLRYAE
ncbi:hypothetical protein [Peribacillus asahii]|uniref:hypothetical protein n=1 Tax=Peribacillus asahii TaxID=228899 RepID=UPI000FDCAEE8|nr:hypothetical protein [Peribacillus asahii]USK86950.1 hypothetical protein LIT35_10075 [Peribacillus asahii]